MDFFLNQSNKTYKLSKTNKCSLLKVNKFIAKCLTATVGKHVWKQIAGGGDMAYAQRAVGC